MSTTLMFHCATSELYFYLMLLRTLVPIKTERLTCLAWVNVKIWFLCVSGCLHLISSMYLSDRFVTAPLRKVFRMPLMMFFSSDLQLVSARPLPPVNLLRLPLQNQPPTLAQKNGI